MKRELDRTIILESLICEKCTKSDIQCMVYGFDNLQKLIPEVLNENTVVKAQMVEWLFTAIHLLDHCCLPLMPSAKKLSRIYRKRRSVIRRK